MGNTVNDQQGYTTASVAATMDHATLKPFMTDADIAKHAAMCIAHRVGNLCVRPTDVALAASLLQGSGTSVAAVVGFPHGASRSEVKALETRLAIDDGAQEVDMVFNIGKFLSGERAFVQRDIEAVVAEAKPRGVLVKVIIESGLLTLVQVKEACELVISAGADYVKTSTGFNGEGATMATVATMVECCAGRAKVKASGGIRTWDDAVAYLRLGAQRLGVGAADAVLAQAPKSL